MLAGGLQYRPAVRGTDMKPESVSKFREPHENGRRLGEGACRAPRQPRRAGVKDSRNAFRELAGNASPRFMLSRKMQSWWQARAERTVIVKPGSIA